MDLPSDPIDLHNMARRRAKYDYIRETYLKYYRMMGKDGIFEEQEFNIGDFTDIATKVYSKKPVVNTHFLVTINPPPDDEDAGLLCDLVAKLAEYKNLFSSSSEWSLEQRSDDPTSPYGYHVHIFTSNEYGVSKSEFIRRTENGYKRVFGHAPPNNSIDIRYRNANGIEYVRKYKHCDKDLDLGPQGQMI